MASIQDIMPPSEHVGAPADQAAAASPDQQQGQQSGPQPPGDTGTPGMPGEPASEEEQGKYEQVVMAAEDVLYNEATHGKIVKMLKAQQDNPAKAIADAAVMILLGLDQQSGGTIPETVILPAAGEITERVAEMASQAGIFEVDQKILDKAGVYLVNNLANQYGTQPSQIQAMMEQYSPEQQEAARSQMDSSVNPQDQPMPRDQQGRPAAEAEVGMVESAMGPQQGAP